MKEDPFLIYNAIRTPDGTVLHSAHRHDFVKHKDKNGEVYFNDGGTAYARRTINKEPYEDLSVYSDAPHSVIREYLQWGTYGKDGDQPLKWVTLCNMSNEHIKNILNEPYGDFRLKPFFEGELKYRAARRINITDDEVIYEKV